MRQFKAWMLALILVVCGWPGVAAGVPRITLSPSLQGQRVALDLAIQRARARLGRFAAQHGWEHHLGPGFLSEICIYDSKEAFDKAVNGSTLPGSFVGVVVDRKLHAVSPQVYAKVHWEHHDPEAWEKLLTHEMAHQLHVDILGGLEDRMGPVWFYEGFAAMAADQYVADLPTLTKETRQHILAELRRSASYRSYEALLRFYMKGAPLTDLVRHAGDKDFLTWLTATFQDVPVPAPTPLDRFKRSM